MLARRCRRGRTESEATPCLPYTQFLFFVVCCVQAVIKGNIKATNAKKSPELARKLLLAAAGSRSEGPNQSPNLKPQFITVLVVVSPPLFLPTLKRIIRPNINIKEMPALLTCTSPAQRTSPVHRTSALTPPDIPPAAHHTAYPKPTCSQPDPTISTRPQYHQLTPNLASAPLACSHLTSVTPTLALPHPKHGSLTCHQSQREKI